MIFSSLLNILVSLVLLLFVLAIAAGAGFRILHKWWIDIDEQTMLLLFILPFGLGLIAYGVALIGLLGVLRPIVLIIVLVLLTLFLRAEIYTIVVSLIAWIGSQIKSIKQQSLTFWLVVLCIGFLFGFTLIQALAPPWDYDGLMYHLQVPKLYLSMHTIHPVQNNWLTYYPSLVEMLYTLGLALRVDVFARLINMVYGIWLALVIYYLCKRFDEPKVGQLAAILLVTVPIYPIWASLAYVDLAWALYEFMGLIALLQWWEYREQKWLALSGLMVGFAAGSKYMGIFATVIILIMAVWKMRGHPRVEIWRNIFIYLGMVVLGCFPWYFKNLIWTGNPFFPLIYRPAGEISEQFKIWMNYMESFGVKNTWIDYLLSPIYLYSKHSQYGTFLGSIEIPCLLFPLVLLYPFTKREQWTDLLLIFVALRYVSWLVGPQQIRYLLPTFPALSILTSRVLLHYSRKFKQFRIAQLLVKGIVGGVLAAGIVYSLIFFLSIQPLKVVLGFESKDQFLSRVVEDYSAIRYIQENLSPNARVLMLWDGRGYYCDQRCLPDVLHAQWTVLVMNSENPQVLLEKLKEKGVTHLLFSETDADFILQKDRTGIHLRAVQALSGDLLKDCLKTIYKDKSAFINQITCNYYIANNVRRYTLNHFGLE